MLLGSLRNEMEEEGGLGGSKAEVGRDGICHSCRQMTMEGVRGVVGVSATWSWRVSYG